jgi:lipoate-protein ligase A
MRLPRQDTPLTLSAEPPRDALARDEALLDAAGPATRWYTVTRPAVVVGLALHRRIAEVVDTDCCAERGIDVFARLAGGGAVLLDPGGMICCTVCVPLPDPRVGADLTESYRWLGEHFAARLGLRHVEVAEARADIATLRAQNNTLVLNACYGALSPHEVVNADGAKIVGLAQVRRKHAALFQVGILLRDQSPLADLLRMPDEATRENVRAELRRRSAGISARLVQPEQLL